MEHLTVRQLYHHIICNLWTSTPCYSLPAIGSGEQSRQPLSAKTTAAAAATLAATPACRGHYHLWFWTAEACCQGPMTDTEGASSHASLPQSHRHSGHWSVVTVRVMISDCYKLTCAGDPASMSVAHTGHCCHDFNDPTRSLFLHSLAG